MAHPYIPKQCAADGCDYFGRVTKGYCKKHYERFWKYGDPSICKNDVTSPTAYLEYVLRYDSDDCLLWPFSKFSNGYARVGGRLVHRLVCEKKHGAPPTKKHQAAHRKTDGSACDARWCVNWRHLRWATIEENKADMVLHGTAPRGENQGASKLTWVKVREIRELLADGVTQDSIAARFGVAQGLVSFIKHNKIWVIQRPQMFAPM